MSADTHPCKELFGVLCSLNTLPSLTLNLSLLIYFHTLSLFAEGSCVREKKKQNLVTVSLSGKMRRYGHGNERSRACTRTPLTAFFYDILNSYLFHEGCELLRMLAASVQQRYVCGVCIYTAALVPPFTLSHSRLWSVIGVT